MKYQIVDANQRGHIEQGWLNTYHSFSFADYYNPSMMHFGMLRVLNDDYVKPLSGFDMHDHRDMEIISIILEGAIEHKDSMGNTDIIHAGEVQVMSAGSGVRHSEHNPLADKWLNLFQIWIFPKSKGITPRYDKAKYEFQLNQWNCVVAPSADYAKLVIHQDAYLSLGEFNQSQNAHYKSYSKNSGVYLMVIEGEITFEENLIKKRDAIMITEHNSNIDIRINSLDAKLLLIEVPI